LRVLLGEPPIDWDMVRSYADMKPWLGRRGLHPAEVIQREVLTKGHRALVVYGGMHFQRKLIWANFEDLPDDPEYRMLVGHLEHAGVKVFTVWTNSFARLDSVQADIRTWPKPSLAILRGTTLGAADFTFFYPFENVARGTLQDNKLVPIPRTQWRSLPMEQQFDAVLYLGPPASITYSRMSPALCADTAYMRMRLQRMALMQEPMGSEEAGRLKRYCAR